jgi:uncharacterized protein with PIN domain
MIKKYQNNISYSSEDFKFLTDATLDRLAKWLRLLGYDTAVFQNEAGRQMLRQADKEGRIVLTRRGDMIERQFSGSLFLIKSVDIGNQLNDVIGKYSLQIDRQKMFGICLVCNEKLNQVSREDVRDLVPPYVFENCNNYNQCPSCNKIYWMGTHQRNSFEFMKKHIPHFVSRFP